HHALFRGVGDIPEGVASCRRKATIITAMTSALISRTIAAVIGIPISANISRWIKDSFAPLVVAMLEARWQSQSAKPAASQSGRTKYIRTLCVTSAMLACFGTRRGACKIEERLRLRQRPANPLVPGYQASAGLAIISQKMARTAPNAGKPNANHHQKSLW